MLSVGEIEKLREGEEKIREEGEGGGGGKAKNWWRSRTSGMMKILIVEYGR